MGKLGLFSALSTVEYEYQPRHSGLDLGRCQNIGLEAKRNRKHVYAYYFVWLRKLAFYRLKQDVG